jgi:outer membrane protein assembly factor BamB
VALAAALAGAAEGAPRRAGRRGDGAAPVPPCPPTFASWPAGDPPEPELVDRRAGAELPAAWEHRAREGALLRFDGVVDAAGHLYWIESRPGGAGEIVSASRDGAVRFRARTSGERLALAGDVVVTVARGGGCRGLGAPAVEGHGTSDGALAWRREVLPAIEGWMREAGTCRYGTAHALAVAGGQVVVAASILDGDTREHESGYVALDAATGEVAWAVRTSAAGNVARSGAPRAADDGAVFAARTVTAGKDPLVALDGTGAARDVGAPPLTLHRDVLAAYGALLLDEGLASQDATLGSAATLEARCRATGGLLGAVPAPGAQPLLLPGSVLVYAADLSRHDPATGELLWRVRLGRAPAVAAMRARQPVLLRTEAVATRAGAVLFAEQAGFVEAARGLAAEPALLREIDASGRETLRRTLPDGPEVYQGAAAVDRGRWFVAAVPYGASAGGVLRAFDVPGASAPLRGWTTREGSAARDNRAR